MNEATILNLNLYWVRGWPGTRPDVLVRKPVAKRLVRAASTLPDDFGLAVFDGWRSEQTIRALYKHFYGEDSRLPAGFLADPDDENRVPPHNTGGAVDLTLTYQGKALALGTWFDDFTPRAHVRALEDGRDDVTRDLRRLLQYVMRKAGFVGIPEEWWHFSYGDQSWAAQTARPSALFGPWDADCISDVRSATASSP